MFILAIDPGPVQSGFVLYNPEDQQILSCGVKANEDILGYLTSEYNPTTDLVLEMVACYGMPVGAEVFDTCVWIGRFVERWRGQATKAFRKEIKLHFCGSSRAKDPHIRQALIDRFGSPGTKKAPGKLYNVKSHAWPALAVAVFHADTRHI